MNLKKTAALLCVLAALFASAGCSNKKDTVEPVGGNSANAPAPTEPTLVTQMGNVGEKSEVGKVEVTVDKLYRSEYYAAQGSTLTNIVFLEVTVTNNSDEAIDANMLTSFEFYVDGELYNTSTLQAISSTQKQFGADVNMLTEPLEIGDSQTGYIPAEVPNNFQELTLYCYPLGGADEHYDIFQAITYDFTAEDFEPLAKPALKDENAAEEETTEEKKKEASEEKSAEEE